MRRYKRKLHVGQLTKAGMLTSSTDKEAAIVIGFWSADREDLATGELYDYILCLTPRGVEMFLHHEVLVWE